jgi:YVTN family beta-propeller protein
MTHYLSGAILVVLAGAAPLAGSGAVATSTPLATGQSITPTAAPGAVFWPMNPGLAPSPNYLVGQAVSTAVSPDKRTLLVLTSGYNQDSDPATHSEFVFVYNISTGVPAQAQALPVPNAFCGVTWAPDGAAFYVAGGQDDNVHVFKKKGVRWAEAGSPIALKHTAYGVASIPAGNGLFSLPGFGAAVSPLAAGMAVTANGSRLIVANLENDSISVINTATLAVSDLDLRPGRSNPADSGVAGGEFPFSVAIRGSNTAYVSSLRDREIVVVDLSGKKPAVKARISVEGNPNKLVLNQAGTRLYATADNSDQLYVIDTHTNTIVGHVGTLASALTGSDSANGNVPNNLTLSPDEMTAYVTNAGTNSLSVIDISSRTPVVRGMIPTGWYPNAVAVSKRGGMLYVVNGKSPTGPIPNGTSETYDEQLLKAGFLTLPTPAAADLAKLTAQVASNNGVGREPDAKEAATFAFLKKKIRHIIYIVKENRTYDQILGDLKKGNGDPSLTMYGQALTPNFHAIATDFVDLDNFYDSGEISMNGWQWSTTGRGNDLNEKIGPVNYGKGGGSYDSEGLSRDINVGIATGAARAANEPVYGAEAVKDPDLLPGTANVVAPDGPAGQVGAGFIWNAAMRANLTVRNYGFFEDLVRYEAPASLGGIAPIRHPYATKTVVGFPAEASLLDKTDPYFRGFDNQFPDYYRYTEWQREFDGFGVSGKLPNFEMVRFMHDHTGNFDTAIDGVNTAELQQADNDYAVGLLIDRIAHSRYAPNTLIFVIEDDSQDGPDHVDSHRSTAYIAGPYVKQGAVVSTRYTTVSMLRTMEDILGLEHLSLHDANVAPMTDVFDIAQDAKWTYSATPAKALLSTKLPIAGGQHAARDAGYKPLRDAAWWAEHTKSFRFDKEDMNDEAAYNRVLWQGAMGDIPYPTVRSGADLRDNREELLKAEKLSENADPAIGGKTDR